MLYGLRSRSGRAWLLLLLYSQCFDLCDTSKSAMVVRLGLATLVPDCCQTWCHALENFRGVLFSEDEQ